ncbi:MAG: hypothetical protein ACOYEP_05765 [Limnochordia bacterium]
MRRWWLVSVLAISVCVVTISCALALAAPRLFLVVTDGLDLTEISADPGWRRLVSTGSLGLINTRTGGRVHAAATHLSIGAAFRADAPATAFVALEAGEELQGLKAGDAFAALTQQPPAPQGVMVLSLPQLQRTNTFSASDAGVGWLGHRLRDMGYSVALVGNADTLDQKRRPSALIAMDERGRIPLGTVGNELLYTDPDWPFGRRTDYGALSAAVSHYRHADLIVIELGDLARLDAYRDRMSEEQWISCRARAIAKMSDFIGTLLQQGETPLLVVTPTPRADRLGRGYWLAPTLLLMPDQPAGIITSRHTRRAGIASNIEVAHVVLSLVQGLPPEPWFSQAHPDALSRLASDYEFIINTYDQRKPVLQSYVIFCIAVFLFSALIIVNRQRRPAVWHIALLSITAFPLALLILPLLAPSSVGTALFFSAVIAVLLALSAWHLGRRSLHSFLLILGATAVALCLDQITRANLIQRSILGYDCIGGARYYGIGNEYVGVLLTSSVMFAGILLQMSRLRHIRLMTFLFLAVVTLVVGAPWWGANNGGAIAALVGFPLTMLLLLEIPVTWRHLAIIALSIAATATLVIIADLCFWPQGPSHLALLARKIVAEGSQPLVTVVSRKIAMNIRLFRYTIWTRVLVVSLAITLWLLQRPTTWVRKPLERFPVVLAGTKGALITAIVALLVNDSGVVAAATAMIPVTTVLLFLNITPGQQQG